MNKATRIMLINHAVGCQAKQCDEVGRVCAVKYELLERIHFSLDGARGNAAALLEHTVKTTHDDVMFASIYRREVAQAEGLMRELENIAGEPFSGNPYLKRCEE